MIEHIIEGRPFLFQSVENIVCHVSEKGVEVIQQWPSGGEAIEALIDADEVVKPQDPVLRESVKLVVASSLKGTKPRWTKRSGLPRSIKQVAVKLWSYKELFLTGYFFIVMMSLSGSSAIRRCALATTLVDALEVPHLRLP